MSISDKAQEVLEKYWIKNKEEKTKWRMEIVSDDPRAAELIREHYAKKDDCYLELTHKGWDEADNCIRRHRLAERLLSDVFDVKKEKLHELGCKFEHVLQKDVEENICTLLGHPHTCPPR
ncbi:metal-dependent transcriptional regulator [Candidatus Omnitrophota bacterium]